MIRATTATWLNYATTIVFQILFAARFGSSGEAGAFVIAFAVAVSVGGVFVTTTVTNVLPRMLGQGGGLSAAALRVLAIIGALAVASALVLLLASETLGTLVAPFLGVTEQLMASLLAMSAVFLATLGLAGVFGAVALTRGHRFLPAFAPAFPSTLGALYLVTAAQPAVTDTFGAVAVGGVIQVVAIGVAAWLPRPAVVGAEPLGLGRMASLTAALLLLMALLPPLQRVLASLLDPAGAAQFDYAARGMQVALQLLLGGLVIAALPDWTKRYGEFGAIHVEVIRNTTVASILLCAAAGVALVAAEPIVRLLYERGAFVTTDTEAVVLLTRVMVPGFVAEGIWLVIGQAVLATGRTDIVLRVWAVRFGLQLILTVILGSILGALGVALAYSLTNVAAVAFAVVASSDLAIFRGGRPLLLRAIQAGAVTSLAAMGLLLAAAWIPPLVAAAAVLGVSLLAGYRLGLGPLFMATLRGDERQALEADA